MSEYRPRPNDHLVEPLLQGIHGADQRARRGVTPGRVLAALVAGTVVVVIVMTIVTG